MDLLAALVRYWEQGPEAQVDLSSLEAFCLRAARAGYYWLAAEAAELLARLDPAKAPFGEHAARMRDEMGVRTLADAVAPAPPWQRVLHALAQLGAPGRSEEADGAGRPARLVWFVEVSRNWVRVEPREQKRTARGGWTKGRAIALRRLVEDPASAPPLSDWDRAVIDRVRRTDPYYGRYYGARPAASYGLDALEALRALVGHPLVFWHDRPTQRVEVVSGEPALRVERQGGELRIALHPEVDEGREALVVQESPERLRVYEINADHRRLAEILGAGVTVPAEAEEQVRQALGAVASRVTVHSDVGGTAEAAETVRADPRPHVQLRPSGEGLEVRATVRPFGKGGPAFDPGSGPPTVIARVDGRRLQTRRNLEEEARALEEVLALCPSLQDRRKDPTGWVLPEPAECLELLAELQDVGERAVAEWPEGERYRLRPAPSPDAFRLRIRGADNWFEATGELGLDDGLVLDMARLLDLLGHAEGRFVPLGDGEFLALTRALRRRLADLDAFAERHGKGLRFHPLAAAAVQECVADVDRLDADRRWKTQLQRLREACELDPAVPPTLEAELRPYQVDGYRWLARLAHWGAGACLADDMGLGKTLQALALILSRASGGPTLVVAPTSVCANWEEEARRFAPTLKPVLYGSGDRGRLLDGAGPFDLVIASYGLLQQDAHRFQGVQWYTAVLDEAQAIKNRATKRSQAAMGLKAGFRLITTGTPLENHLGELWNLFRFINPGLLGSHKRFTERFAAPIERDGDGAARERLKKLLSPFVLRRTKAQVLDELPPRTEICLRVELGQKERAFYEALRLRALERIGGEEGPPGQQRMTVLAEIMRLRRACCHPRLVTPGIAMDGAKLEALAEILEELRDNRHRALIFSQFVDHLALVRELLDARGIPYQYLDGSTPSRERKRRITAFQAGEGEVFLISLKAGGTGINLTAADYVVHLDPWWNPAVEDQASDRAHRIGQTRPVTVYRLVAAGTIEEKIVELHRRKRDLADSLLEGTDSGARLSLEELTELLREG
ncbi:MAG: hypothetical protein Kow0092_20880 [Deferrisomatales bacterium]